MCVLRECAESNQRSFHTLFIDQSLGQFFYTWNVSQNFPNIPNFLWLSYFPNVQLWLVESQNIILFSCIFREIYFFTHIGIFAENVHLMRFFSIHCGTKLVSKLSKHKKSRGEGFIAITHSTLDWRYIKVPRGTFISFRWRYIE